MADGTYFYNEVLQVTLWQKLIKNLIREIYTLIIEQECWCGKVIILGHMLSRSLTSLRNRHRASFLFECECLPYYAEFRLLSCHDVALYIHGN